MKLFLPAFATLSLAPQVAQSWSLGPRYWGPGFYGQLISPSEVLERQQALVRKQQNMIKQAFKHSSPRYEITDTDDKFQVAVDVPGVNMEDIHVNLENDGTVLSVRGRRSANDERQSFTSSFAQSFSVDPAVDVDKFSANLKNGVLIIAAPKDLRKLEDSVRKIPVTMAAGDDEASDDATTTPPADVPVDPEDKPATKEDSSSE